MGETERVRRALAFSFLFSLSLTRGPFLPGTALLIFLESRNAVEWRHVALNQRTSNNGEDVEGTAAATVLLSREHGLVATLDEGANGDLHLLTPRLPQEGMDSCSELRYAVGTVGDGSEPVFKWAVGPRAESVGGGGELVLQDVHCFQGLVAFDGRDSSTGQRGVWAATSSSLGALTSLTRVASGTPLVVRLDDGSGLSGGSAWLNNRRYDGGGSLGVIMSSLASRPTPMAWRPGKEDGAALQGPSGFEGLTIDTLLAPASDGELIPISIVRPPPGCSPSASPDLRGSVVLYGYGAVSPSFCPAPLLFFALSEEGLQHDFPAPTALPVRHIDGRRVR